MDRSMIPLDQEYGKRAETVGLMRQAGMPQGAPQDAGSPPVPAAAGAGTGGPAPDLLMERQPTFPPDWRPPDPLIRLRNLAQTSPNAFLRALLQRILAG